VDFQLRLVLVSSIESIKFFVSVLSPDHKTSKVTTRSKEKDIQTVHVENINARKVAERMKEVSLFFHK